MLVSPIYSSSQGSQQTIIHKQVWLSRLCNKAPRNNVVRKPFLKERKTTITEGYKIADLNQFNFVSIGFIFITSQLPLLATSSPPPPSPQKGVSSHSRVSSTLWIPWQQGKMEIVLTIMTENVAGWASCFSQNWKKIEQGPWLRPD